MSAGNLNEWRYRRWLEGDHELGPVARLGAYNYAISVGDQETADEIERTVETEEAVS